MKKRVRKTADSKPVLTESEKKLRKNIRLLKKRIKELEYSESILKAMNSHKDKFFSIVTHDLKNPFNSLLGLSEILHLEIEELNKDEISAFAANIYKSSRSLYNLLENLLQWSRIQMGRVAFQPERLKLRELAVQIAEIFQPNADSKKVDVQIDIDSGLLVYADKNTIDTILRNLLSNALKFTHQEGKVKLIAHQIDNSVLITVEDNGIGMSKEELDKLFRLDQHFSKQGTQR